MNIKYMGLALDLAEKGRCYTRPNPKVGCVVVKNNRIIGRGYHKYCGDSHAEVNALRQAGRLSRGAELYVNLEPCSHWGRTPPCTESIIKAGIKSVYFGMQDPNPMVGGRGEKMLKKQGIKTVSGALKAESEFLNREFIVNMKLQRPYILLKQAQTLDGKIATKTGDSKWITGSDSRRFVHRLRAQSQGIMVGINTLLKDNPYLTSHGTGRNPVRILIDPDLKIPLKSNFLIPNAKRIILTSIDANKSKSASLESLGCTMLKYRTKNRRLDIQESLRELYKIGICQILIEPGGSLGSAFLEAGCVDELIIFIAPKIFGGRDAKTSFEGGGVKLVKEAWPINVIGRQLFKKDIMIRGLLEK